MDRQIRALTKGMSNVKVMDADSPEARNLIQAMTRGSSSVSDDQRQLPRSANGLRSAIVSLPAQDNRVMPRSLHARLNGIEVRPSRLHGRGMFAVQRICAGHLVLYEMPLAIYAVDKGSSSWYSHELGRVLSSESISPRKLALLQQLVDQCAENEAVRERFFALCSNHSTGSQTQYARSAVNGTRIFDASRAVSIINHNAHVVFPGSASDHHDLGNRPATNRTLTAADQRPGIWLQASMVNHSCTPNASWSWTGDLLIMRANRDIDVDEEVTIAYVPSSYDYDKRQSMLQKTNGFRCDCALCKADSLAVIPHGVKDALLEAQQLESIARTTRNREEAVRAAGELVPNALLHYPAAHYGRLPCLRLAEPFYQLGRLHLTEHTYGKWHSAMLEAKNRARDCFQACLEIGLGYKLVYNGAQNWYDLLPSTYSQPKPIGVLALMALAELAYDNGKSPIARDECGSLKAQAQKLYGIWYGEDKTFNKHHQYYSCKEVPVGGTSEPNRVNEERCEDIKKEAAKRTRSPPAWLLGS